MYRVIHTSRSWPIRCTLFTAWASAIGFHCGSIRWTWLAALRSILENASISFDPLMSCVTFESDLPFSGSAYASEHHGTCRIVGEPIDGFASVVKARLSVHSFKAKLVCLKGLSH